MAFRISKYSVVGYNSLPEPLGPVYRMMLPNSLGHYNTSPIYSAWSGGKVIGSIGKFGQTYVVRYKGTRVHSETITSSAEEAFDKANKWLYTYSRHKGLLVNRSRTVTDNSGTYLEVQADSVVFKCDHRDKAVVDNFSWRASPSGHIRAYLDGRMLLFHRFILGVEDKLRVRHIDKDKLNNRRANLQQ
jgi:hypothetical protein